MRGPVDGARLLRPRSLVWAKPVNGRTYREVSSALAAFRSEGRTFPSVWRLSQAVEARTGMSERTARRAFNEAFEVSDLINSEMAVYLGLDNCPDSRPACASPLHETPACGPLDDAYTEPPTPSLSGLSPVQVPEGSRGHFSNARPDPCVLCGGHVDGGEGVIPNPYYPQLHGGATPVHCAPCWERFRLVKLSWDSETATGE